VQTDADRIAVVDAGFPTLVDSNPLSAIIRRGPLADAAPGYVAPRLHAIWARFPYLHNGSVPSLQALLSPEADRPAAFGLEDAGEAYRFDRRTVGLTVPATGSRQARALDAAGARGARDVYDVRRVGHSNRGHRFGTMLAPDLKRALIEYLKTL
jgi:hypothetical protein